MVETISSLDALTCSADAEICPIWSATPETAPRMSRRAPPVFSAWTASSATCRVPFSTALMDSLTPFWMESIRVAISVVA